MKTLIPLAMAAAVALTAVPTIASAQITIGPDGVTIGEPRNSARQAAREEYLREQRAIERAERRAEARAEARARARAEARAERRYLRDRYDAPEAGVTLRFN